MTDEFPTAELVEPRKRRSVVWPVSLTALFVSIALLLNSSSIRIGQGVERDARERDRATIEELRAAQAEATEITNCVRVFAAQRDETRDRRDTALADAIIVAVSRGDTAAAVTVYQGANDEAKAASKAYGAYITNPVTPCPVAG